MPNEAVHTLWIQGGVDACSAAGVWQVPKGRVSVHVSRWKCKGVALGSKSRADAGLRCQQFCSPGLAEHLMRYLFVGHGNVGLVSGSTDAQE